MLYYALAFFVVGLIAAVLRLAGLAAVAGQIAWVLFFLIGITLLVVHLVSEWRGSPRVDSAGIRRLLPAASEGGASRGKQPRDGSTVSSRRHRRLMYRWYGSAGPGDR